MRQRLASRCNSFHSSTVRDSWRGVLIWGRPREEEDLLGSDNVLMSFSLPRRWSPHWFDVAFSCDSEADAQHRITKIKSHYKWNRYPPWWDQRRGHRCGETWWCTCQSRSSLTDSYPGPVGEAISPVTWAARLLRRRLIFSGSWVWW